MLPVAMGRPIAKGMLFVAKGMLFVAKGMLPIVKVRPPGMALKGIYFCFC